jgi:hypothetical protein
LKFIRYQPQNEDKVKRLQTLLESLDNKNVSIIHETFLHEEGKLRYLVVVSE